MSIMFWHYWMNLMPIYQMMVPMMMMMMQMKTMQNVIHHLILKISWMKMEIENGNTSNKGPDQSDARRRAIGRNTDTCEPPSIPYVSGNVKDLINLMQSVGLFGETLILWSHLQYHMSLIK